MANRPGLGVWAWPFRVLRKMRGDLMEVAQRLRPPWRRWMTAHAIGHNLLHWGSHLRMQEHTLLGGRVEREADETEPSGRGRSQNPAISNGARADRLGRTTWSNRQAEVAGGLAVSICTKRPLTRSRDAALRVAALFLAVAVAVFSSILLPGDVLAQSSTPTVQAVAIESDPGEDGGYAIGDEIQVGLTFSEAVTVTGAPQLTLDVGGQSRTAEYSEGSTTTQLLFTYTVAPGDEDTDGIAVVASSLALNGGAIRAGSTNATLTHAGLHSASHKVDGIAPTVTVGGESRPYVPPDRQFNVVFYFSEKVYGITTAEITVTNGEAHDVQATGGNDTWPKYTRWDVIIQPAAEGPVTVTIEAGAGADAYGNENTAPDSALEVIAATPVTVEVARTTSGFAEGGKAEFTVTRSGDNGAIPVFLSLAQTGDLLSGAVQVYPPADPNNPGEPVTPQEFTFTETPFNLNVTFAAGETSKRIAVPTEDDYRDEEDGTVTLSVPARPDQYKYIPGHASSATADVRDNDVPVTVSLYWIRSFHPYTRSNLDTALEGGSISLVVYGRATGQPLQVTLAVTEVGSYLDLDGDGAWGYENLGNGKLLVTLPVDLSFQNVVIPLVENDVREADGSVTITIEPDPERSYTPSVQFGELTVPVKDNDTPSTVSISAPDSITEGGPLSYTLTRTWAPGESQGELSVNVELAQTGDYITWPTAHQPDADGLVTIPVNFAARSLTATLTLETVDDQMSEDNGSVTATILADADGRYVTGADSDHTTKLMDDDPPIISVEAVAAAVTEGEAAQFRFTRSGDSSVATRVGLWVGGLPKIMTDATDAIALTADNADLSQRLHIHGAWVDYILEFAAGETEKTLSLTTEADNVNEGDGWLGVTIVQRAGNPFGIGTGYAQVHIRDDDVPTVTISQVTLPTGAATLEGDTWVGELGEVQPLSWVVSCSGNYEYSPLVVNPSVSGLIPQLEHLRLANHPAYYRHDIGVRLGNNVLAFRSGGLCDGQARTHGGHGRVVGPDGGVETFKLVSKDRQPAIVAEYREAYRQAKAAANAAGTPITQHDIIHEHAVHPPHTVLINCHDEPRYCPQYRVGTPHKIRLTLVNRDPTILIKAESTTVEEGQAARFIVERLWHDDLLRINNSGSETVVALRASQNGQYITGALPTEITFGRNETSKTIELATVDDAAFGANGSVTIELLPDTTGADLNIAGKYETSEHWAGHTPEGARSDRATIAITNNDTKPGITIAPASAPEGDTGSADMTFTVTLAKAVTEAVTVNYATSDGTAIAGQDYTAVSNGSVTIAAGNTTAEFTVSMTGDETDELDETFTVTISMPEPDPNLNGGGSGEPVAAISGGDTAAAAGTILDDDPAVVTVAPKVDTVEEGEPAVFVLTRAGMTNGRLAMQVRLRSPGRLRTLDARFEPGAVTTEIAVATPNNNLVDYPSVRDYTIEVFGDGAHLDRDDQVFTPGTPATATVKVTDDDELINVTVYPVKALLTGGNPYFEFRRDGDASQPLTIEYAYFLHTPGANTSFTYWVTATFKAGQDEVVIWHDFGFDEGVEYSPADARHLPLSLTYVVSGDGGMHGLNRIYQGGAPNAATVTMSYNGHDHALTLGAETPFRVSVGQTVSIPVTVTNTGTLVTRTPITITATHKSNDPAVDGANEPRMSCRIAGPIAAGESAVCQVSFLVQEKDLNPANYAEIELDVIASDGRTTSNAFRIFMSVLNGISVGFNEAANVSVTEPRFGEANAKANLTVTRVGRSAEEVQVAYTMEPWPTGFRSYSPVEGVDYADNSATPGVITFGENETEKTITIDILGDQIDEAKEQFLVTLVPPEGVLVEEDKRTRIVVINDTNPPPGESYRPTASLQLVGSGPVPESEGPVEFAIVLDREWGIDARYEVELTFDQLTATPGIAGLGKKGDFEDPGVLVVRIPAGQTRFEFSIPLYDDDVREEDETFQLLLGSSIDKSFRTIGPSNTALATIADDDRVPPTEVVLSLSHNGSALESVPEGSTQQDITVTALFPQIRWPGDAANAPLRPADPRDVDTTVRVRFDPNSGATHAAGLDDFEPLRMADDLGEFHVVESFEIVIPAGQTSANATVRFWPVKDDVDEEDETVTLLGSELVAGGSQNSLPVRSASFTIIDDDTRGITLSPAKLAAGTGISMMEGGTSTYSLVLDSEPTDTVTVTVAGRQGDLISLTPETLTFTPSDWSTAQTISVVSLDDGTDTSFTNAVISHQVSGGDYGSVTVRDIWMLIKNTTQAYIYLDDAQASESDGYVEFTVTVRPILRTTPVLVRYATVDGTAIAGSDYTREVETGQTYKILNIPEGQHSATIRIPITDDQVYESADETFALQLTNHNNKATLDGGATSLTATGVIADDDPKPVLSVAGPAGDVSYVSENAKDPVTFTLTLMGQSAGDVTVDYATGEAGLLGLLTARQGLAGATQDEDYAGTSGTVTFTSGQTTKTVTVQVTNDDVSEETEFFGFTISAPQGADLRGQRSEDVADVGLLDDDPRGVTIAPTSIGLHEPASGETAVAGAYTVNLNSRPTDTVTVTIGGSDPAVSLSGDTLTNNQLTFTTTNWNTAQTITVTPVKDDDAVGETITLTHTLSGGDYAGIAADSVTVNLTDSDTRNLVLSGQSLTVTEGDATGVRYTVKLATQPSDTVTVTISGHDGADLTLSGTTLTNNQLTFTTTNWNTVQTITVKGVDDDNTDDESETLAHTAFGGDYVNITKDLPVSITDDDDPEVTVSFDQAAYSVAEGDMVTVTVTLSADPERTVEIELTATDQGASPADYSGVPARVTFNAGDTEQTFDFEAAQDDEDDDDETVVLGFGTALPTGVSPGPTDETTVSITDDDDPEVTVSFDQAAYSVAEGDMVTVTVTLSADPERTVEIELTATDQDASPADYSGVPARVTFNAGDTEQTFDFEAAQDDEDDDDETVVLGFGTALPTGVSPGPTDETTVSITDDDDPEVTVSFDQAAYSVAEGDMVTVTVTLSADPERTVEIELTATDQDASPADYSGVPARVTFNAGDTEQTFDFEAAQDDEDDDDETVVLGFGTALPTGVSPGPTDETTVSITDDDDPEVTVSFDQAAYSVAEGDMVTVTVRLSADPERTVEIELTATGQDGATSPADYTVPTSVTFNTNETSKTITFRATADALDDDGERVLLGFGTPLPTGVSPGPTDETTVSIDDDDDPEVTVSFDQAAYSVAEGDMVTVTVRLSADPERTVEIPITATGQDGATSPADYTVPTSVTFNTNETSKTITFRATADALDDDGERVLLGFGTPLPTGVSPGPTDETTVSIDDDDDPEVTVSFDQAAYTVAEGDMVTVTVTLSADPERTVEIELTATDQGASPADYSGVPARVTFNAGDTEQTFDFEAAQDDEDDDDETVVLGFGTALPTGVSPGPTDETTVSITDDDDPEVTVSFDQAAYTVAEGDMVTVTVTLSADPERTVEIELTATDQGASPADYSGVPARVTFNAGDTEQTFDFEAAQDDEDDDDETVVLGFGTALPTGVSPGPTDETTVSIGDDDVTAVNTPPTAAHGTVTTNEDTPYAFAATDFGYLDDDSDALASVKIIALPVAGTLILDGTAIASGALPKTVAAADLTASKLKYSPPANANGTGFASFTFKVNDGRADSTEYIMTINVTPVNDPATGAPAISGTAHVGETLTASIDGIDAIADADGLPSSFTYQWKRYAANGTTLEANIGADASTYTLTESEEGKKVKVEVSFTDNGGTSEGPLISAAYPASLSQTVGAAPVVNTPPTASDGPVTTNEDTLYAFAATDFGYLDDDSDALASVKIIALPVAGTLILDGTAIASGALPKTVAAADLTASKLKYTPPANANGTGFASFTFKVNDGRADSTEYIMTINVTPVNDPATGAPAISGTAHVGETLTASIDGIDAIADADGLPSSFTYQWIRVGADGTSNPTDIGGNSNTYLLTEADFGKRIKVRVDFTDGQGGAESRTSDAYPRDGTVQRMTVQFEQAAYTVAEGGTVTVTVTLSVDPEHMMVIPIAKENMGGAGSTDYSGVPHNVTFNAGDTSKSFDFDAAQDDEDDDGESVRVVLGSSLPPGVSLGALAETVVSIGSRTAQQLGGNVGQTGTVVTITRVPGEDSSTFVEGTEALFRLNFEAVGGGPSPGGVDVHLRYSWHIPSPLVTAHGYASQGTWSVPRVDVWDSAVPIHDNDFGNPDGTLTIRIIGCERSDCMIGTPSVLTLTITDDDGGPATAVPGPPGVPRLVCARSGDGYDDTGIAVSWKAPNFVGGAPVESYELRYRESSQFVGGTLIEHRWKSWPHGVAATSATLTGLVPRASYTVQVRAVNGNGPGLWSEPWRFRVGPTDEVCEIIDQLTPP